MRSALIITLLVLASCATVASSLQYTQGSKALEDGDFEKAAVLLAEAVRLDPEVSRNRNNLAAALFELGRVEEGWPHVRKAVLLDPRNDSAALNCKRYFVTLLKKAKLDVGSTKADVVRVLGQPDDSLVQGRCTWFQYGSSAVCFEGERFAGVQDMERAT